LLSVEAVVISGRVILVKAYDTIPWVAHNAKREIHGPGIVVYQFDGSAVIPFSCESNRLLEARASSLWDMYEYQAPRVVDIAGTLAIRRSDPLPE
jgi:hypothetical protein